MEQVPQQGLGVAQGVPQAQQKVNPYHKPNASLVRATDRITGADQAKLAQAQQAGAQAGKAQAEAEILAGLGALTQQANPGLGLV